MLEYLLFIKKRNMLSHYDANFFSYLLFLQFSLSTFVGSSKIYLAMRSRFHRFMFQLDAYIFLALFYFLFFILTYENCILRRALLVFVFTHANAHNEKSVLKS
jgi:hypothetical protein